MLASHGFIQKRHSTRTVYALREKEPARTSFAQAGKEEWKREVGAQQRTSFFSDVVFCFRNSSPCVTQADIRSDSDGRHAVKSALIRRAMHVEISKYGNDIASRRLDEISSPQACQALFSILRLLSFPPVTKRNSRSRRETALERNSRPRIKQ